METRGHQRCLVPRHLQKTVQDLSFIKSVLPVYTREYQKKKGGESENFIIFSKNQVSNMSLPDTRYRMTGDDTRVLRPYFMTEPVPRVIKSEVSPLPPCLVQGTTLSSKKTCTHKYSHTFSQNFSWEVERMSESGKFCESTVSQKRWKCNRYNTKSFRRSNDVM